MPEVLGKMSVEISSDTSGFGKGLDQARGKLNNFSSEITKIAGTIGIAFGAKEVASFGFEVAKLAGEAEGVRAAFSKLPESEKLMGDLTRATAGTVAELDLMKRSVQAANFGIELQALPDLLKFATLRAQQTGQSVDYLVDSIVTGIGRKSPLILDNLGISATALKNKLGGVSIAAADIGTVSKAVGAIASDELKKMGDFSENTSTKVQRLSASWENFKVVLGNVVNSSGALATALDFATDALGGNSHPLKSLEFGIKLLNASNISAERYAEALKDLEANAKLAGVNIIKLTDATTGLSKIVIDPRSKINVIDGNATAEQINNIDALQEKIKQLNEEFTATDITDKKRLANIGAEIIAINAQIEALDKLRKARKDSEAIPNTVDAYQKAISELNKEIESTNVTDLARIRVLSAEVAGYQQAIDKVNGLKRSFTDLSDVTFKVPDLSALLNPVSQVEKTTLGGLTFTVNESAFDAAMKRIEARILETANNIKKTTTNISKDIEVNLTGPIASAVDGLGEALGRAAVGVGNFGQDILKVVANFGAQLGKILIAEGVALLAAKFALKNPYTAIAAGVALVAISSALNASVSKAHSSAFGGAGGVGGGSSGPREAVSRFTADSQAVQVQFDARFRVEGDSLVAVLNNTNHNSQRGG